MAEEPHTVQVGSKAPDFALEGVHGTVRLADYSRQSGLLLFFLRAFG